MKHLPLTLCALILLLAAPVMAAADCPTLVRQALAATNDICQATGQNQACYGNIRLQAKPNNNIPSFAFSQPGDRVNLSDIKSLQLSRMSLDTGEWGVALMHIQANLPPKSDKNLVLLAFGDVAIQNDAPMPTEATAMVSAPDAVNVRWLPSVNAGAVAVLQPGQQVMAVERLADSSWLRINLPDSGDTGWVKGDLLTSSSDLSHLNVSKGDQPSYRPMQAFTFSSGNNQENCSAVPQDGLIIQTPEGSGEVKLWINQVIVKLGSTVYFQAQPNGDMIITTLEGHATVEAMGVTHTAVAGTSVHVKMNADLTPASAPTMPDSYTTSDVQNLPVNTLQRPIEVHAPLTQAEVAVVQQAQATVSTVTNTVGAVVDTAATVVNETTETVGNVVNTVGNTTQQLLTGGNTNNDDNNNTGNTDNNDDGGNPLDPILHLPCLLLQCKK